MADKNLTNVNEIEEITLIELIQEIFKFVSKYKKIIGPTVLAGALLGGIIGLKLDRDNRYYKQEITFNDSSIAQGKNPDGTKFDEKFLIEGAKDLIVSGVYPTYIVTTPKGILTDEMRRELEEIVSKNSIKYLDKHAPIDRYNIKNMSKAETKIKLKSLSYFQFLNNVAGTLAHFIRVSKNPVYILPLDYGKKVENVNIKVNMYKEEIEKKGYVKNREEHKKSTEILENDTKLLEKKLEEFQEKFEILDSYFNIISLGKIFKNSLIETPEYKYNISEYVKCVWDIQVTKKELLKLKEKNKKTMIPSLEEALKIDKAQDDILKDIEILANITNPIMEKYFKEVRRPQLLKIENLILVKEKDFKLIIVLGLILGGLLGFLIAAYKEFLMFNKKTDKY